MGGGAEPASKLLDLLRVSEELPCSDFREAFGESGVTRSWGVFEFRSVEELPTPLGNGRLAFVALPGAIALGGKGGGAILLVVAGGVVTEAGRGGGARCCAGRRGALATGIFVVLLPLPMLEGLIDAVG